jgi:hypothetical protein
VVSLSKGTSLTKRLLAEIERLGRRLKLRNQVRSIDAMYQPDGGRCAGRGGAADLCRSAPGPGFAQCSHGYHRPGTLECWGLA